MARKNDLSFLVKNKILVISEHQSTINQNMPLRNAIYLGRELEKLIPPKSLYRNSRIPLPTPEFYVFYNGSENYPAENIIKLSDSYLENSNTPMLELIVKVININLPQNHSLLEKCQPLYEYSWLIQRIKEYIADNVNRDDAIIKAMEDCRQEGILLDFLEEHGSEAVNMLFTEFNMDDALEVRYEEGFENGKSVGFENGRTQGELHKLVELVCKKLAKNKSAEEIADSLEEDIDTIRLICDTAAPFAPEYDAEQITAAIHNNPPVNL